MKKIVQLNQLSGYDHELELARQLKFEEFMATNDNERKRSAMRNFASLTALRTMSFIGSYERALGLRDG